MNLWCLIDAGRRGWIYFWRLDDYVANWLKKERREMLIRRWEE